MRQDSGGIASYNTGGKLSVTNCYYLTGTSKGGVNSADTTGQAEAKKETEMQTEDFVNTLNKENNPPIWKKDTENNNNGYPVLK